MTGTDISKPPKNNAEWARKTEKRLSAAENSTALRAGDWVLSTDSDTGNLIAGNVNGGSVVVAEVPDASSNPDTVVGTGQPFIRVERQNDQSGARGSTQLVQWDTLAFQTSDWGFVPTATDIVVPKDGIYRISYHLAFKNSSSVTNKAVVLVDAVVKLAQELLAGGAQYPSFYLTEDLALNAGTIISCGAFTSGSGTMDFGASGADPTVFTSLSLLRLDVTR